MLQKEPHSSLWIEFAWKTYQFQMKIKLIISQSDPWRHKIPLYLENHNISLECIPRHFISILIAIQWGNGWLEPLTLISESRFCRNSNPLISCPLGYERSRCFWIIVAIRSLLKKLEWISANVEAPYCWQNASSCGLRRNCANTS